uniref:Uncharacterized protein n=1 Tax=Oryza sativa subsp. japonica TaxID=39947 RepID=Q69JP0_ORYSJ|nr:hypothetical protein [Oryza sativa Japonica Group]
MRRRCPSCIAAAVQATALRRRLLPSCRCSLRWLCQAAAIPRAAAACYHRVAALASSRSLPCTAPAVVRC